MQDGCIESGAIDSATRIAHVIHKNVELVGRYLGQFAQHHVSTKISILVSEDYLRLRQAIIMSLRPHREARIAVSEAIQRIENQIAKGTLIDAGKAVGADSDSRALAVVSTDSRVLEAS
jgi:hypothetical protein